MRIAHVLTSLHIGGGERVALLLATLQKEAGHDVAVVSFEEPPTGPLADSFRDAGIEVQCVPKRPGFDFSLPPRLLRHFRTTRPDIVHTHNPLPLTYAAGAARGARARVLHTKHGPHPDKALRLWLRRAGAAATSAFVAVSEDSARFARSIFEVWPSKLHIIENGVDTDRFHPNDEAREAIREELDLPRDAFVVGTVGRMAPVKNHALLVRAMAPVLDDTTKLVVVGWGDEREATERLADKLGVAGHCRFTGPRSDVDRIQAAFDVFALSSLTEGLPLVIPEAMATELPVVATAVGGVPKVVEEGRTGHLVPSEDERALREKIIELREAPERRREMGKHARELSVQRYSARRMARDYMALYKAIRPSR